MTMKITTRVSLSLRSFLFYLGYCLSVLIWGTLGVLIGLCLPYRIRFIFIVKNWTRFAAWWMKVSCKISYDIEGLENIPAEPCVIASNHQSPYETFILQTLFVPVCTIVKKELIHIPFFGWGLAAIKAIAIDRSDKQKAINSIVQGGKNRLAQNIWVLIFPEGTRMKPSKKITRFARGAAGIAILSNKPVLPVAHNAGEYWPAHKFLKYPGTIKFIIGEPIYPKGYNAEELTQKTKFWIESKMQEITTLNE